VDEFNYRFFSLLVDNMDEVCKAGLIEHFIRLWMAKGCGVISGKIGLKVYVGWLIGGLVLTDIYQSFIICGVGYNGSLDIYMEESVGGLVKHICPYRGGIRVSKQFIVNPEEDSLCPFL
jgi:hypothetical protein